jgi:CHAT domain-containing protein/predicted negative regulator of RcsB-dependent stress response
MLKSLVIFGLLILSAFWVHAQETEPLVFGKIIEKNFTKPDVQRFKLTLKANQFARVEVQQKGVSVNFDILDAKENQLIRVVRPLNAFGRKIASVLAEEDAEFYLQISLLNPESSQNNPYSIKIAELRDAKSTDKLQIETEKSFMQFASEYVPIAERLNYFQKFEEVVAAFEQTQGYWYQSLALLSLGRAYALHNDRKKAIGYYERSLMLQKTRNITDPNFAALAHFYIGIAYNFIGEPQLALDYLQKALAIEKSIGNKSRESDVLTSIGTVYFDTGSYQKALSYYEQAVSAVEKPSWRTRRNVGITHAALGDYDKALEAFKLALPNLDFDKPRFQGNFSFLRWLAWIYTKQGKYDKAKVFYEGVLQVYRERGIENDAAVALTGLGNVYHKLGESDKALSALREAIPLREKGKDAICEALTRYYIAKIQTDKGNLNEALNEIDKTINLTENLREKIISEEARIEYLSSVFDYYELYIEILFRLHKKNPAGKYDAKALQISEKVRARSIIELLNFSDTDIKSGVSPELLKKERELQTRINELARSKTEPENQNRNENYDQTLNKLFDEVSEIRTAIRRQNPQYASLTQNLPPVNLDDLQNKILDSETVLLEYKLGKERSFVWTVTANSFAMYELPKQDIISAKAKEYYSLITARNLKNTDADRQTRLKAAEEKLPLVAKELSDLILAPVAKDLKKKRIVIVADGSLQYIPFSALPLNDKYLVESAEILTVPSATFLSELRKRETVNEASKKLLAVIADPVFDRNDSRISITQKASKREESLPRLLFSRQEANAIAAIVPKNELFLALDFNANKLTATDENLANYRIVHFATHGVLDSEHPELSGLVFSMHDQKGNPQNGFLRLHEIYNLKLPADLVVLSGCQTGLGKKVRGEGLIGLTRGFMYAGASRVAASLWQIDDSATAELMKLFYQAMLKEKQTPAQALRRAKLQMLAQKRWQNPYFWASFTIQGDWR